MHKLHRYVNRRYKLKQHCASVDDYHQLTLAQKVRVRNLLADHPELFDEFAKENNHLDDSSRELLLEWKHIVPNHFGHDERGKLREHSLLCDETGFVMAMWGSEVPVPL